MRISDWSSDVCSSDLACNPRPAGGLAAPPACAGGQDEYGPVRNFRAHEDVTMPAFKTLDDLTDIAGKRVLVRVDLNVPVSDGKVTDATRIERVAPEIREPIGRAAGRGTEWLES